MPGRVPLGETGGCTSAWPEHPIPGDAVSNPDTPERTSGGVAGKLAGKAKAAAGDLLGRDDLAREGRLQEAQSDAEIQAREEAAEAKQREQEAAAADEKARVEQERRELNNEIAAQQ